MAGVTFAKRDMLHERDPGEIIKEAVGDLSDVDVFHNLVLIGIYKRPEKTKGGIIVSERSKQEDIFQGIVGYVLKVGPAAFKNDAHNDFHGVTVKEGDWVLFRPSDSKVTISVNGEACRLLEDAKITGRVGHPDRVF